MKTRRIFSLILTLALLLALAPAASAADLSYDVQGGKIYFDASTGTITKADESVTAADIPSEIYGVPVTAIGEYVFNRNSNLSRVTIPSTVTSIGRQAFCSTGLTSVVIPDSVTSVGQGAFERCLSLSSVTLGKGMRSIPRDMFHGCTSLTGITIPDNITSIGYDAFTGSSLISITIPDSITTISNSAFDNCKRLESVYLPDSVTSLGEWAFSYCTSLTDVRLPATMTKVPNRLFESCHALETCTIPDGVTYLGDAFRFCSNLKTVYLPASLLTIDSSTFYGCDKMTDVYYGGTALQWSKIEMGGLNDGLDIATIHFAQPVAGFSDVTTYDYYAQAVQWAVDQGVTTGTSATAFSPSATVTRAEAVTFLWRAAGKPEPVSAVSSFSDVTDQNAYYYKAVLWAVEQGITNGTGGGRFDLTGTLTYDQIFTMLGRAAGVSLSGSDWSSAAVSWAKNTGLTDGLSFSAKTACPRADVIYCLWKQMA